MSDLITPTIHINGTSEQELVRQFSNAVRFLEAGRDALAQTAPHARDYYIQADKSVLAKATEQHQARMTKVKDVIDELTAIGESIINQSKS